ncbi:E3 ubiquitin-protein ligase TRIM33-like [Saccostrea cucullata]|uniref:E3 ubiquitin-protein ligase TRIM33-like n=1 Tax=Saccostrea cuccullata TaxID=36930 RepID=UPI002ED66B74
MASSTNVDVSFTDEVWKCSICFEQFKNPRVLPCSHSFCHECLSSYITTACQGKAEPVGFHCPLCRKFAVAPSFSTKPSELAEQFPINRILWISSKQTEVVTLCEACKREDAEAKKYCLTCLDALCENCADYHTRNRTLRDHELCDLNDKLKESATNTYFRLLVKCCSVHKDRPITLYCNDHETPCCTMCVSTEHRKCDSVDTIEQTAEKIRQNNSVKALLGDFKDTENMLSVAKTKQDEDISKIDDMSDKITEDIQNFKEELVQHIENLESKCLDQVAKFTKESRGKMTTNAEAVNDKLQLSRFCIQSLENVRTLTDVEIVMEFQRSQQHLKRVRNDPIDSVNIKMEAVLNSELKTLTNIPNFASIKLLDSVESIIHRSSIEAKTLDLELWQDVQITAYSIRGMVFLNDANVVFTTWSSSKTDLIVYALDNTGLKFQRDLRFGYRDTFDIKLKGNILYLSSVSGNCVKAVSGDGDFKEIFTIHVGRKCYGIDVVDDFIYVTCDTSVIKTDTKGNILKEYKTPSGVRYVVVTRSGLTIIYSCSKENIVKSIYYENGDTVWTYSSPNLKNPYGLQKDSSDNVYVADYHSSNVHVLSSVGSILRIFENLPHPISLILIEQRSIALLCCHNYIKVIHVK